ncbi:MAG TPA: PAS domain S-box protein [Syntrophorhabdales bacterium]|nr:PAS domain S-box protein [Syntrophorhabdales bacterium]
MTRNRVLIMLSAFLLAVVSLLTFHLYRQSTQEVLSQFHEHQLSYAKRLSTQIQFYLQARSQGLKALSSLVSLRDADHGGQRRDIEAYAQQIDRVYVKAISLYNAQGGAVYSTDPGIIGAEMSDSGLFLWAQKRENRDKVSLRPALQGPQPLMFTLAIPLYRKVLERSSDARFAGVLLFTLDMKEFLAAQLGSAAPGAPLDQIWIIDRDGTLLFQPDHPDMAFRNIYRREVSCRSCHTSFNYLEEMLARKQGIADYGIRGHPKKIAAFAPMEFESVSWLVVVSAPYDRVPGFVKKSLRDHLLLLGIVLLAVVAGSGVIIRKDRMKIRADEEVVRWQEKIAERGKAEEALQLERNKLKGILDSMSDGVYIVNQQYEMVYSNPVVERECGPIKGRRCYEYLRDQPRVCRSCPNEEVLAGRTVRREWYSHKTGKTYDLFDTPFAGPDGIPWKLGIIRDISDRARAERALRESEERHRMLVETMNDGLGVQDENGVWTYVNNRFAEMLGYSRDEMIGRPLTDFLNQTDLDTYRRQMVGRIRGETGFYEMSWLRKSGRAIFTLVSSRPIFDEQGQFKGSFAVLTEITERKRVEEALRESEEQLRHLSTQLLTAQETERKRISRELHDELGQALTVMKLHINFIEKNLSESQAGLRKECEKAVEYIDQVIENVRRLSRDLSPIILEDFGLSAAIRWLVSNFAKRYTIKVALDMVDIDALIPRDSQTSVYRVIQEALTNIGKHSQAENVSLRVREDTGFVLFSIEDDGKGFDAIETVTRGPEEKGLGLATMRGRTQVLGGTLTIRAEEGKGTRISLSIPIADRGGTS